MKNGLIGILVIALVISLFFNLKKGGVAVNNADSKNIELNKDSVKVSFILPANSFPDTVINNLPHPHSLEHRQDYVVAATSTSLAYKCAGRDVCLAGCCGNQPPVILNSRLFAMVDIRRLGVQLEIIKPQR